MTVLPSCWNRWSRSMRDKFWLWWAALGAALGCAVFAAVRLPLFDTSAEQQAAILRPPLRPAPRPVFVPEPPPAEASSEVPTLVEASTEQTELRVKALAAEMA